MSPKKRSNPLIFNIARLWGRGEGTTEKYELDVDPKFETAEFNVASPLTADLLFVKMKGSITVIAQNLCLKIKFECPRCLKNFVQEICVPECAREFKSEKRRDDPIYDVFYINMKDMEIDLSEMFRQEIILHFPLIAVCSERCKGLCPVCGKDRNRTLCKCTEKEPLDENKPFRDLKKMFSAGKKKAK